VLPGPLDDAFAVIGLTRVFFVDMQRISVAGKVGERLYIDAGDVPSNSARRPFFRSAAWNTPTSCMLQLIREPVSDQRIGNQFFQIFQLKRLPGLFPDCGQERDVGDGIPCAQRSNVGRLDLLFREIRKDVREAADQFLNVLHIPACLENSFSGADFYSRFGCFFCAGLRSGLGFSALAARSLTWE
jgi:hypothetical protein